jgi:hypothetical protein
MKKELDTLDNSSIIHEQKVLRGNLWDRTCQTKKVGMGKQGWREEESRTGNNKMTWINLSNKIMEEVKTN